MPSWTHLPWPLRCAPGGYFCDFPSPALVPERGVVALPHLGASTAEAEDQSAMMAVDQLHAYLVGPAKHPEPAWMLGFVGETRWRFLLSSIPIGVDFWGIRGWRRRTFSAAASTR